MLKSLAWPAALTAAFSAGAFAHSLTGTVSAQTPQPQPQVIHITDIPSASIPTVVPGVKVKDVVSSSSGDVGVVEITNVPRHQHNNTDELIYVIKGTGTATLGDNKYTLKPGDLVVLPRAIPHDFQSKSGVRVLGIAYPKDDPKDFTVVNP